MSNPTVTLTGLTPRELVAVVLLYRDYTDDTSREVVSRALAILRNDRAGRREWIG